jgi:hemin uptake protein HemP
MDAPTTRPNRPAPPSEPAAPASGGLRRVRSEELLKGGVEILIDHHGREYRLRVTQNGKLILTA